MLQMLFEVPNFNIYKLILNHNSTCYNAEKYFIKVILSQFLIIYA